MQAMEWTGTSLKLLDQTLLPASVSWIEYNSYSEVAAAINKMVVRGAPAIGAAAAYGLVLAAQNIFKVEPALEYKHLEPAAKELAASRPTAVNLAWALERMGQVAKGLTGEQLVARLEDEALAIGREDAEINHAIGHHGQVLIPEAARILTHCNTGALATVGYGTALGVIRRAAELGKDIHVYADETRPFLQGSRLTMFELMQEKIPATLLTDSMAGWLMALGKVDLVIVGADRVAANGDVANKIGTYALAVLAKAHSIPFYVACPLSTLDLTLADGKVITIEERAAKEVTEIAGIPLAPEGAEAWNPAFDVTPARLVSALITEKGVIYPPYGPALRALK